MFKSVADFFRPTQQVTLAPTNNTAGNTPAAGTSQQVANTNNEPADPLASLKDLWQTDPNIRAPADPFGTPLVNVDVAKLKEGVSKLDLSTGISQDLLQKAMSGTDPAAFMQVINMVGQNAVATSTQLTASTVEAATTRNNQRLQQVIPTQIKQAQMNSEQLENPILQHPAAAPFVSMTRQQVAAKNPNASPSEINRLTEQALVGFATAVSEAPVIEQQQRQASQGTDWDKWAGIDSAT